MASTLHLRHPAGGGIHLLEEVAEGPFWVSFNPVWSYTVTVPQLGLLSLEHVDSVVLHGANL